MLYYKYENNRKAIRRLETLTANATRKREHRQHNIYKRLDLHV